MCPAGDAFVRGCAKRNDDGRHCGRLEDDRRIRHARFARGADEGVRPYTRSG